MERRPGLRPARYMVRTSFCLLAGAMALQLISFPPGSDLFVALLVALVLLWPWLRRRDLVLFLFGLILFWHASVSTSNGRLERQFEGDSLLATIRITDFPNVSDGFASFLARPCTDLRVPAKIRLTWPDPPVEPRIGDIWQVELRLRRPRGHANPGGMDAEAWMHREGIGATGYVVSGPHNRLLDSMTERGIARIRSRYVDFVSRTFGLTESSSVVLAITVGARHAMTPGQWHRYAATGTSHLMAISGLHVGLAALAAYWLVLVVAGLLGYQRPKHLALLAALLVAAGYSAISGFAVPAQRATLMLALGTVAVAARREIDGARVLAMAAMLIVALAPLSTMQPGFRLSFAAVAVLLWWSRHTGFDRPRARTVVSAQFALFFALLPLVVFEFGRVSFISPFVNLVAVPVFTIVTVPAALLSVVLPDSLALFALEIALLGISVVDAIALSAADNPDWWLHTALFPNLAAILIALPLFWLAPRGWPGRHLAVVGVFAITSWRPQPVPAGCIDFWALDVGHGLAVIIRSAGQLMLYDTGAGWRNGDSVANRTIVPWMRAHRR